MRAQTKWAFGAAMGLVVSSTIAPGALADPSYTAANVVDFFTAKRSLCIGTSCKKEAPTPTEAHFDLLVTFAFNSDELTPAAKENLDQFAMALKNPMLKVQKFEIDGHTDAVGTEIYNQGLSERRAASVVSYLVAQGIDPSRFTARGFGKTRPRVSDPFSAENRRVETHLTD